MHALLRYTAVIVAVSACGSSTGPGGGGGGGNGPGLTATVDGHSWKSDSAFVHLSQLFPGSYNLFAVQNGGSGSITLDLYDLPGPGTYAIGTSFGVIGADASYVNAGGAWSTPLSGASGTLTITTLTTTHIVGTFSFTADSSTGSAHGSVHVTNGKFDVSVATPLSPPAPEDGSRLSATLGGTDWNAATLTVAPGVSDSYAAGGGTLEYNLTLGLNAITGPGTYPLSLASPVRSMYVQGGIGSLNGPHCCWGNDAGDVGSVTITSFTSTRMKGTFTATLQPEAGTNASAPIVITNGTFDFGIPQIPLRTARSTP
jgi:Family of unknown function (DUF6252)